MHIMMKLFEQATEELEGARCYTECALNCKDTDRELADMYIGLARTEMDHYTRLRAQASRIASVKMSEYDVPEPVQEVFDWYNTKLANEMASIKVLMESYK